MPNAGAGSRRGDSCQACLGREGSRAARRLPEGAAGHAGRGAMEAQGCTRPGAGNVSSSQPDGTRVPLEIVLMEKVGSGCRSIIQLLDWFELPDSFVLVLERPERSRDLLELLREQQFLSEEAARWLFCQVLEAVWHCTACGVWHGDIKAENLLVDPDTGSLKLIDFGCGTFFHGHTCSDVAGTRMYCSPEWICLGFYRKEPATIWSLGVLLYVMVCGCFPFRDDHDIEWGPLFFWRQVSPECQHLITWCLGKHPLDRANLEDIWRHPWVWGGHL